MSWGCTLCCGSPSYSPGARGTPERFASVLGAGFSGDSTNFCTSVTVTPAGLAHPVMSGVTLWGCPFHGGFATTAPGYSALVRGSGSRSPTMVARDVTTPCLVP